MVSSAFRLISRLFLANWCLALLCSAGAIAEITVEEGKSRMLQGMLQHTTWPDEGKFQSFTIGLYGRDRELLQILKREARYMEVRGKPVFVTQFNSLSAAKAAHILVVAKRYNTRLAKIEQELHESHTLMVTDASKDPRHIMINFTYLSGNRLSFEINRSNIVYAGLQLSKQILLFGGTELDAATIYKETEAELVRAKEVATEQEQKLVVQEKQLGAQQQLLDEQKSTIEKQRQQVATNNEELRKLEKKLSVVQGTLEESAAKLIESEQRLWGNEAALKEKEGILAEKEAYIATYSERIEQNLQRLEDQQAKLKEQERQIANQEEVLTKQVSTIENQQFVLFAAAAALLLVLTLIVLIFRGYRSKHRIARELEGKTRELQAKTQELEETNEQLVQVTEAKSRFLSTMSHEIRTPMNGVIGIAELLEGTSLSNQQREYVSLIIKSADTLLGLINDILDFSKIEAGSLELEAIPFSLRDILGDTLQSLGLRAAEKGLELTYHIPPDLQDRIIGDPLRLRQIVVNLVGNAIKFTEVGEVVVDLHLESTEDTTSGNTASENDRTENDSTEKGRTEEGRAKIVFEVRDTGMGITEFQQQKIFEAFGQADSSTTRQFGGTGLGLAIASQLAEMMGGKMSVKSEIGEGSTFSFSANFRVCEEPQVVPLHPDSLRGERALVVDDNSTNRTILEELLMNWGMDVTIVESGAAALEAIDKTSDHGHGFSLALLDVMMPQMDGYELASRIRKRREQKNMRILMLTSAGRSEDETRRAQLDISRILLKPIKHSDLLSAVTDALGVTLADSTDKAIGGAPMDLVARQVLLVEDNLINQKVAKDLLAQRGHHVDLAQNGAEALVAATQRDYDVVLMDVHMPIMDGLSATRAIREHERGIGTHVPIIAMTAGATTEDREHCFSAGMDDFVTKPFRAEELYKAVEDLSSELKKRAKQEQRQGIHQQDDRQQEGRQQEDKQQEEQEKKGQQASAETDDNSTPCLDWSAALRNVDGDEVLLRELAEMFLSNCAGQMEDIRKALATHHSSDLKLAAHTLKGSARVIGGQAIAAVALELENMGRDGQFDSADETYSALEAELAALRTALQPIIGEQT